MNKKILIIKTGSTIASLLETGVDFEDWFAAGLGIPLADVMVRSLHLGQPLPPLPGVKSIIITGSAAYVTERESWNFVGADYLREAHRRDIPVLGVCYGHQLLAWAFGGEVDFHPDGREIGSVSIRLTEAGQQDELLAGLSNPFNAQTSHQQSVTRLPDGAVLLAENDFDPHHAFRLGKRTWGVQFHPEFGAAVMRYYIRERHAVLAAEGLNPEILSATATDSPEGGVLLRRFGGLTAP